MNWSESLTVKLSNNNHLLERTEDVFYTFIHSLSMSEKRSYGRSLGAVGLLAYG